MLCFFGKYDTMAQRNWSYARNKTAQNRRDRKLDAKKIVSYVGTILMILSVLFIARRLINDDGFDRSLFEHLSSLWVIGGLLLIAMAEGLGILCAGLNFRAILKNVSSVTVDRRLALAVYTESNVYKYIPGGVMYAAGRNRLAIEVDELTHGKVVLSTILEGIGMVIGVITIAAIFAFNHTITYIRRMDIMPIVVLAALLAIVTGAIILYCLRHRIGGKLKQMAGSMEKISLLTIAKRLGFSICIMFFYSLTFLFILMLMGQEMSFELGFAVIGLYLLAWLAGFLTPGAPSGLGVREVVMMMFLGDFVSVSVLAAAMVMHRVLTAVGDVAAYVFAKGLYTLRMRNPH